MISLDLSAMISGPFCAFNFGNRRISDHLPTMEQEVKSFIDNVDAWIKQIRREFSNFQDVPSVLSENTDNIQHNYELIYELKDQVEELKQEINALKLIQIISLKKNKHEEAKKIS